MDSVLPIDCATVAQNFELGVQLLHKWTHIDEELYRSRMHHVDVWVRSAETWNSGDGNVAGYTTLGHIEVSKYGTSLLHETLHAYGQLSGVLTFVDGMGHSGWSEDCAAGSSDDHCGYLSADGEYEVNSNLLQPWLGPTNESPP